MEHLFPIDPRAPDAAAGRCGAPMAPGMSSGRRGVYPNPPRARYTKYLGIKCRNVPFNQTIVGARRRTDSGPAWKPRMGGRFWRGAAHGAATNSRSAPRGKHPWFPEKCPPVAIHGFPCGLLCARAAGHRSAYRFHHAARARQGSGAEPDQAACARSGALAPGAIEPRVVNRFQSPAQSDGSSLPGAGAGSPTSLSAVQWMVMGTLRLYQLCLSPLLPSACRFYPTCSQYMMQAVEKHGVLRGVWMGTKRLAKCHPFHAGGIDPVR